MLPRISAISVLALVVLAAATPTPITLDVRGGEPTVTKTITVTAPGPTKTITAGDCTTGPIQCCNSVQEASSQEVTSILGLLGIVLNDITALVGLQCSPISIIGIVGGGACSAQPVCCENNSVNSIISIGCIPIFL